MAAIFHLCRGMPCCPLLTCDVPHLINLNPVDYTPPYTPPPPPPVRLQNDDFIVTTSTDGTTNACYLDGQCVRANYGDDQECQIQARRDLTLDVTVFNVEGSNGHPECRDCQCDYMCGDFDIDFHSYPSSTPPTLFVQDRAITICPHLSGCMCALDPA